jgi:predicted DCC family thiol-disulfide oxidoreductase YuxK
VRAARHGGAVAPISGQTVVVLIYDGDCGFCTASARWIEQRLDPGYPVVPWQSIETLDAFGLTERDVTEAAYWIDVRGRAQRGARAIAHSLMASRRPWPVAGRVLLLPPISWLAALVYAWVARNRHRLPGATDACAIRPASVDS